MNQLTEANKCTKNKLVVCEIELTLHKKCLADFKQSLEEIATFRRLCGLKKNNVWLLTDEIHIDKASGKPFYTPEFDSDVGDPANIDKLT
jgi:hypothetical protein